MEEEEEEEQEQVLLTAASPIFACGGVFSVLLPYVSGLPRFYPHRSLLLPTAEFCACARASCAPASRWRLLALIHTGLVPASPANRMSIMRCRLLSGHVGCLCRNCWVLSQHILRRLERLLSPLLLLPSPLVLLRPASNT